MVVLYGRKYPSVEVPDQATWVGGEGEVFLTISPRDFVVKRPYESASIEKAETLTRWVPRPDEVALPEDMLSDTPGGPPTAFLMRFVPGHQLFVACHPAAAAHASVHFTFRDRRRIAINLCLAVEKIHAARFVIGDLNLLNCIADPDDPDIPSRVTLIDADSFQFDGRDPKTGMHRRKRCLVGTPETLAPEYQGKDLSATDRTREGDYYSLALVVWLLLHEGRHAFAVRNVSGGPIPTVGELIQRGQWPRDPKIPLDPDLEPVETDPRFEDLPQEIQSLFERAFKRGHADAKQRPTAREWASALEAWEKRDCPTAVERIRGVLHAISRLVSVWARLAAVRNAINRLSTLLRKGTSQVRTHGIPRPRTQRRRHLKAFALTVLIAAALTALVIPLSQMALFNSSPQQPPVQVSPRPERLSASELDRFDDAPPLWRELLRESAEEERRSP